MDGDVLGLDRVLVESIQQVPQCPRPAIAGNLQRQRLVVLAGAVLAVSAAFFSIGCDSNSTFLPPPPDGLRGSASDELIDLLNQQGQVIGTIRRGEMRRLRLPHVQQRQFLQPQ